jgi:hypothetical protein
MEINRHHPRGFLLEIVKDGETMILNPLHAKVENLSWDPLAVKEVCQCEKSHG